MTKKCNVAGSYRTVRRKFLCVLADFCVCYAPVEIHGPQITSPFQHFNSVFVHFYVQRACPTGWRRQLPQMRWGIFTTYAV